MHLKNQIQSDYYDCSGRVIKTGDHLASERVQGTYHHHGIYIGNGKVIHYAGFSDGFKADKVCQTTIEKFSNGNGCEIIPHYSPKYDRETVVSRAQSRLGEDEYNLLTNNCEHFVNWCIYGKSESRQVKQAIDAAIRWYVDSTNDNLSIKQTIDLAVQKTKQPINNTSVSILADFTNHLYTRYFK
ncbi:lecithin retinol acyltransferase family protein [Moraxella sp. ZJ142]|uniref:lecithin retinol acyltransferase family protein n=1 Tax=Moraxella marmotae TaxID=3344520 RepID=UPI0035D4B768